MSMTITLSPEDDTLVRDEGTVVVLQGRNSRGTIVTFGVDHRMANDVLAAVVLRDEEVEVEVEPWQVLGRI